MVQITKCKCGSIVVGCQEPFCYTDAEYQRDTRKLIKKGYTVEMVESGTWPLEDCKCISQIEIFEKKEEVRPF